MAGWPALERPGRHLVVVPAEANAFQVPHWDT